MNSNAPTVFNAVERLESRAVELSHEDLEILRVTVFKGANDAQLRLYARNCQARGLDPFAKEIYAWSGRDGAVEIVVGIDGLRNLAESSGEYRGQQGPWFCGEDGQWTDVWLQGRPPLAAKVTVLREGHEPMTSVALLAEFKKNSPNWNTMPTMMLAKCAEANAIRRQFPRQTTGLYIREEMGPSPERRPQPPVATVTPMRPDTEGADDEAVDGDIIDAETGEIVSGQRSFANDLPENGTDMIDRQQRGRILFLAGKLGWEMDAVNGFAGEMTGISNVDLLSKQRAAYVIEQMEGQLPPGKQRAS